MYESMTYEFILEKMLNKVITDNPNVDTREGSVIYNALAPAAAELTQMYIALDAFLNETFVDTASRDYLIKRCAERGITPEAATKAILKGVFNIDVPFGSRFAISDLIYAAKEKISAGVFKMECETTGSKGNTGLGTIIPLDYIDGLTSAATTELLIPGQDEEETEVLRQRYYENLSSQAFGGNIADYKLRTKLIPGVGGVKVLPFWNLGGTVKLIIITSAYGVPTPTLIDAVQAAVNEFAPIGHQVTVAGVTSVPVFVVFPSITYQEGYTWLDVEAPIYAALDAYYLELAEAWDTSDTLVVRKTQIETRLLSIPGIVDITCGITDAGGGNLELGEYEIPVRGVTVG